jgi:non-lysosomal glucosylceramidase
MAMPQFAISKMRGWAAGQLQNGMIQEQLGCGCTGAVPVLDEACGRVMSDVSSQFIVYLLELKQGGYMDIVHELWDNAAAAANWHIAVSQTYGIPDKLQTTYDVLGLNAYDTSTYSSLFHLLAMRSCSVLADAVGDSAQKGICDNATLVAQRALDNRHWVEDAGPPPAGVPTGGHTGPWSYYRSYCDAGSIYACGGQPVDATMADDTFAQVIAYNLGLGTLVANVTRLRLHLQAVSIRHETPYGMMIMVGRELPYPGTPRDNALWQMASPNWAALAINSGLSPSDDISSALVTAQRSLQWWRSGDMAPGHTNPNATGTATRNPTGLADQWNIAGVVGGIGLPEEGAPWITAHYGYAITAWRIYIAMAGQVVDLSTGSWSFDPKPGSGTQAGRWSVVLVGAVGQLEISTAQPDGTVTATLSLASGPPGGVPIKSLDISSTSCPLSQSMLQVGSPVTCKLASATSH